MFSVPRVQQRLQLDGLSSPLLTLFSALSFLAVGALHWFDLKRINWRAEHLAANYVDLFGLMLGQGLYPLDRPPQSCLRNPLLLYAITSTILRQLFSSQLTAHLLSTRQLTLDYFSQLDDEAKGVPLLIENGTSTYSLFAEVK